MNEVNIGNEIPVNSDKDFLCFVVAGRVWNVDVCNILGVNAFLDWISILRQKMPISERVTINFYSTITLFAIDFEPFVTLRK